MALVAGQFSVEGTLTPDHLRAAGEAETFAVCAEKLEALLLADTEGDASPAPAYRPQHSFYEITEAMLIYGGGFVHNLAVALRSADETNKRILVMAFQDYWRQYDEMAKMRAPDPPVQP